MSRALPLHLAALAAASALFLAAPGLDLWASGLFYRADTGFFLADWGVVRFLYRAVPWLVTAEIVVIPLLVGIGWWRHRWIWGLDLKAGIFVLAVLAVGPGLLVNTVLKDHWGRARPSQTTDFGGTQRFTAAPLVADQCERNCSFVAGHPAVGFALVAYAFLARQRRRRRLIAAGAITIGSLLGVVRLAQGGHFLSDVVFSGLLVSLVASVLATVLLERDVVGALGRRLTSRWGSAAARWTAFSALVVVAVVASFFYADRPTALYFHEVGPGTAAFFRFVTRFGVSTGYLIATALAAAILGIAARVARDPALVARFKAFAAAPLFIFASIAVCGLATDLLKIGFGRARPKLLFSSDIFGFEWLGMRADYWSFPSGHTTTAVAIAVALYCLWPRSLPFAAVFAFLVSLSRVMVEAHYVSDVIAAVLVALAGTIYVRRVFERSGIDLRQAAKGVPPSRPALPWRARLGFGRAAPQ